MFHTAGMCFLTVVINGTSMRYLIRFLGMDKMAPAKARMFSQALRKIAHAGTKREQKAMREGVFATVVWEVARGYYVREEDMLHETHHVDEAQGLGESSVGSALGAEQSVAHRVATKAARRASLSSSKEASKKTDGAKADATAGRPPTAVAQFTDDGTAAGAAVTPPPVDVGGGEGGGGDGGEGGEGTPQKQTSGSEGRAVTRTPTRGRASVFRPSQDRPSQSEAVQAEGMKEVRRLRRVL